MKTKNNCFYIGPVAVKKLNVSNPTEQQMQAFKNEVAVLMWVVKYCYNDNCFLRQSVKIKAIVIIIITLCA